MSGSEKGNQIGFSSDLVDNSTVAHLRRDFIEKLDCVSEANRDRLGWWLSNAASRNVFMSSLFRDYCSLELEIEQAADTGRSTAPGASRTQQPQAFEDTSRCGLQAPRLIKRLRQLLGSLLTIVRDTRARIRAASITRLQGAPAPPSASVTLFETFVYQQSFSGGTYTDRYFQPLLVQLKSASDATLRIMFELYNIQDHVAIYRSLREDGRFLILEDYLTASDYLYALLISFFPLVRIPGVIARSSGSFSALLRRHLSQDRGAFVSFRAALHYRFIRRLRLANWRIEGFVNWWENQWMDKAEHLAIRRFFPGARSIGYYGAAAWIEYMAAYPTPAEYTSGVLPDQIAVIGKGWRREMSRFCPEAQFVVWPAYRYLHLWKQAPPDESDQILIALPMFEEATQRLLTALRNAEIESLFGAGFRCCLRPHPAQQSSQRKLFDSLRFPATFQWESEGAIHDQLRRSLALVGSYSSTCLEALAIGVPVVFFATTDSEGLMPPDAPASLWTTANDAESLGSAIQRMLTRVSSMTEFEKKREREAVLAFRELYFENSDDALPEFFQSHSDHFTAAIGEQ